MPVTIQISNVPDEVHRELQSRAAKQSMSLSAYLLDAIVQIASAPDVSEVKPAPEELLALLKTRPPVTPSTPGEDIIRHHRDGFGGRSD
jgi:hypothetical protein